MYSNLNIKEVRSIVRKNIIKSMLNENNGSFNFVEGNKVTIDGVEGYKLLKKDQSGQILDTYFVPNDFKSNPDNSTPKKRDPSNRSVFIDLNDQEVDDLKGYLDIEEKQSTQTAVSTAKTVPTEISNILNMNARQLIEFALSSDSNERNKIAQAFAGEEKSFKALNDKIKKKFPNAKPFGFVFEGEGGNIDRSGNGKDHASIVGEIDDKEMRIATGGLGHPKPEVFAKYLKDAKDAGYSYFDFAELSKTYAKINSYKQGKSIMDAMLSNKTTGLNARTYINSFMNPNGVIGKIFTDDSNLNKIPLFNYVKSDGSLFPVYVGGYEKIRQRLFDAAEKALNSQPATATTSSKKSSSTVSQQSEPSKSSTSSGRIRAAGTSKTSTGRLGGDTSVAGVEMVIELPSDSSIRTFDDLGFKSGTDVGLRRAIGSLVKKERKFKGTGVLNLELLFNKNGNLSKVKFRKGQSKLGAYQIEMLKSKIKEYLRNAKFEPVVLDPGDPPIPPNDLSQWFALNKEKLISRGNDYKRGGQINLNLEIY